MGAPPIGSRSKFRVERLIVTANPVSEILNDLSGFLPSFVQTVSISMQNPEAFTSLELLVALLAREVSTVFGERLAWHTPNDLKDLFGFLSECNQILERNDRRQVICVDEYENIDQKIGQGVFPEDLLATFRESIQSHPRILWIFAGSHEITELVNAPWTSYLASTRTVEVPLFSNQETRLLLTEPLKYSSLWRDDDPVRPRIESSFWGEGGIERIHTEAGGWPNLVQLIAETIVDLLSDEAEMQVTSPVLERALDRAIVSGHNVLHYRGSTVAMNYLVLKSYPQLCNKAFHHSRNQCCALFRPDGGQALKRGAFVFSYETFHRRVSVW